MVALQVYVGGSVESWTRRRRVRPAPLRRADDPARDRPGGAVAEDAAAAPPRALLAIVAVALRVVEPRADGAVRHGLMDRQRLELGRNAYDAFVTIPAHGAAARLALPLRARVVLPQPAAGESPLRRRAHPLPRRHPVSAGAGERHPDDGDVPCARATRARRASIVVRPDTHAPARDPYAFYGLPAPRPAEDRARAASRGRRPRGVSATWRSRRAVPSAHGRPTSCSRAISASPRSCSGSRAGLRPPLVYESHGYAPDVAAALPALVATARPPRTRESCARLAQREERGVAERGRLCHDHRRAGGPT